MFPYLKTHKSKWILIDATGLVLGRLASFIAYRLRGKNNPMFTPHLDCGDNVIVINSDKIVSYNKKLFYKHTGYVGSIKSTSMEDDLSNRSDFVLKRAVRRMLPRDRLLKNLRVYKNDIHDHTAQKPELINFKSMNRKNVAR